MAVQTWHNVAALYDDVCLDHITEQTLRSELALSLDLEQYDTQREKEAKLKDVIENADHEKIQRALSHVIGRENKSYRQHFRYADAVHAMTRYWHLKGLCGLRSQNLQMDEYAIQQSSTNEGPPIDELVLLERCIDDLKGKIRLANDKESKLADATGRKLGRLHLGKFMVWWWVHSPDTTAKMTGIAKTIDQDRRMLIAKLKAAYEQHNKHVSNGAYKAACKHFNYCGAVDGWCTRRKKWEPLEKWYEDINNELNRILTRKRIRFIQRK